MGKTWSSDKKAAAAQHQRICQLKKKEKLDLMDADERNEIKEKEKW